MSVGTAEGQTPSCESRVSEHLESRLEDLRPLLRAYQGEEGIPCGECKGCHDADDQTVQDEMDDDDNPRCEYPLTDEGLNEYGLSFDYVAPGTFTDQEVGYFRYQLSWGGPSDEFRFYTGPGMDPHTVEYWFLDWYDGAKVTLAGDDLSFVMDLWGSFLECAAEGVYQAARGD